MDSPGPFHRFPHFRMASTSTATHGIIHFSWTDLRNEKPDSSFVKALECSHHLRLTYTNTAHLPSHKLLWFCGQTLVWSRGRFHYIVHYTPHDTTVCYLNRRTVHVTALCTMGPLSDSKFHILHYIAKFTITHNSISSGMGMTVYKVICGFEHCTPPHLSRLTTILQRSIWTRHSFCTVHEIHQII